jgi:hypothetical protein
MVRQLRIDNQDRQRRVAARALDIAHCQHCNGTFNTSSWLAADKQRREARQ